MIDAGSYHTLTVARVSDHGLYLADGEGNEVLLPNRWVSLANKIGDAMEVFVYHDSEDRPVATTEKPLGTVGRVVMLRVVDKTVHGAFLDWGLGAKDLFMPNRNMTGYVEAGQSYPVLIYRDRITGRAVATMSLSGALSNDNLDLRRGQQVDLLVVQRLAAGYRVVIDDRFKGMIYDNQIFSPVAIGDRMKGWVRKITDDNRVDVSLQQEGYDEVRSSADRLMALLESGGGRLGVGDDSAPDDVRRATGMSKKVFKRAVGYLLKRGKIVAGADEITVK